LLLDNGDLRNVDLGSASGIRLTDPDLQAVTSSSLRVCWIARRICSRRSRRSLDTRITEIFVWWKRSCYGRIEQLNGMVKLATCPPRRSLDPQTLCWKNKSPLARTKASLNSFH
jgi:hypothetical protein